MKTDGGAVCSLQLSLHIDVLVMNSERCRSVDNDANPTLSRDKPGEGKDGAVGVSVPQTKIMRPNMAANDVSALSRSSPAVLSPGPSAETNLCVCVCVCVLMCVC